MTGPAVLGLNTAHDASACLLVDGRLVVAVAEERLTREKHRTGFPQLAIEYCLQVGGMGLADVDCVVLNEYPQTDFALEFRDTEFAGTLVVNPSHHLLHAYYAWIASGFSDTAVLVVDGSGYHAAEYERRGSELVGEPAPWGDMDEAETHYVARGGRMELVRKSWGVWDATLPYYRFPSLGHMFSAASQYIFGHWQHAGKTMGLAPYGDTSAFPEPFVELLDDGVRIDTEWITRLPPRSAHPAHLDEVCRNLAAKVQAELERALLHTCATLHAATGVSRLAISGGVALNSVANGRILRESPFTELFVTPAAADSGVAIGAALYGHHRLTGELPVWDRNHDHHGRTYSDDEIDAAADARTALLRCTTVDDVEDAAAADIAAGRVVGWFEGGSEFGPRSLGHRSILCDARVAAMRDRLNERVKYREPFRPYAASVLAAHVPEWFDLAVDDPYMLIVADVRAERRDTIPSVCHVDHTCRVQSVGPDHPGRFRGLLEAFHARTGVPMVLNTSFNVRGEPIVETPGEAMDCFLASTIDVLYLEDRRVTKATVAAASAPGPLVPHLSGGLSLDLRIDSAAGAAQEPQYGVRTRTGHRSPVTAEEFALLRRIDGRTDIDGIGAAAGICGAPALIADLQVRGLLCVELPAGERS